MDYSPGFASGIVAATDPRAALVARDPLSNALGTALAMAPAGPTAGAPPMSVPSTPMPSTPGGPLTTWHSEARPTKHKPMRRVGCAGCSRDCCEPDHFFPKEYARWGYYSLISKVHPTIKQPGGWWCWECDGLADHQPEDKAQLKEMLYGDPVYKQRWNEEWLPKQRTLIAVFMARGEDRLPKQSKRVAIHEEQTEGRVYIPGTWMEQAAYNAKFPNKAERTHKSSLVTSPETNKRSKAFFIPDNEKGVWRGEHGNRSKTADRTTLTTDQDDVTGDAVERFMTQFHVTAPKVVGKSMSQIEAEKVTAHGASADGSRAGGDDEPEDFRPNGAPPGPVPTGSPSPKPQETCGPGRASRPNRTGGGRGL